MGEKTLVSLDERGRVLIPKQIRERLKARVFTLELLEDGSLLLKPVLSDVLELAGRFKGLVRYGSLEELEERQEEYLKRERRGLTGLCYREGFYWTTTSSSPTCSGTSYTKKALKWW